MQWYVYLLYISYLSSKCQIGCLDIIEHQQLYLVKNNGRGLKKYSIARLQIVSDIEYNL